MWGHLDGGTLVRVHGPVLLLACFWKNQIFLSLSLVENPFLYCVEATLLLRRSEAKTEVFENGEKTRLFLCSQTRSCERSFAVTIQSKVSFR
jgi:hypothetical protein